MTNSSVLLTGASGYIGGAVLAELTKVQPRSLDIYALVRSAAHAELLKRLGVYPVHFDGLHDLDAIRGAASQHDIVISCASAMDLPSCKALVEGLGDRKAKYGGDVHYIHTSGTSGFGDHRISGQEDVSIRADTDSIFDWEKANEDGWILRKVDVLVTELGLQLGVKTHIVNPPLIYGIGSGPVNKHSLQIPLLLKISQALKQAVVIWSIAHIADVAAMYGVLVGRILDRHPTPDGKDGYFFTDAGEVTWQDISNALAREGHRAGLFASTDVKSVSPDEFAKALGVSFINGHMAEVIWASNSRTKGIRSRSAGWNPTKGVDDLFASLTNEVQALTNSGT